MPGGVGGRGPTLRVYLTGSYSYMDGLVGPVTQIGSIENPTPTTPPARIPSEAVQSAFGGAGLSINRTDTRSAITLGYQATYSRAFSNSSNIYQGLNQDLNLNYERQLSRRWGFYTGHTAGTQSSVLGLVRQSEQRNLFDQSYSVANEVLDSRLNFFNSGAGTYFQMNRRITFSFDGGVFAVSRKSQALASSRGERAQGEFSYRISRAQSIGAFYSFSHFYFPRGFGETYTHSVMLALTRTFGRRWSGQLAVGPYQSESERLRSIPVDPFIAALTGQTTAISVFHGTSRGLAVSAAVSTRYRRHGFSASYRRGVDPGNGLTLSSVNDYAQTTWGYQGGRKWSLSASAYGSRLKPLLEGAERRSDFRSFGGSVNFSYRLAGPVHAVSTFAVQTVRYELLSGVTQLRRSFSVGIGYSPGEFALSR
jgi:hypothetical protein